MEGWQVGPPASCAASTAASRCSSTGGASRAIRGDKAHPTSQGYTCEKPARLDHYQNGRHRLTSPLRRARRRQLRARSTGTPRSARSPRGFARVRDAHGGESILYYGGGGQGNHLPGAYSRATRAALGSVYASNALAQEKTGEFWVDGQLFGAPSCHTAPDFEHAEVAVFVGKNPWQSHGFPRARAVLREIAKDPARTLVVIDPRRTETAELADFHLQVRPGTDAFCLAALLAVLVEADGVDARVPAPSARTGAEAVLAALARRPDRRLLRARRRRRGATCARWRARIARAESVSILEDLGIQQAPHSTLNSYLEKLLYLLTGNFAQARRHEPAHALRRADRARQRATGARRSAGHRIIGGLLPCNAIPEEILTDHPKRFRALLVESANPAHSLADSQRMREALEALDFVVVIDVALTETARLADYVLPAASQFEKWEATFFTLEFPQNVFHLRAPLLEPLAGHAARARDPPPPGARARRARRGGARAAARGGGAGSRGLRRRVLRARPRRTRSSRALAPVVLYETLGPTLPDGAARGGAAARASRIQCAQAYPESLRRAGFEGANSLEQGDALFDAILRERSGVVFSVDEPDGDLDAHRTRRRPRPPRDAGAARRAARRCASEAPRRARSRLPVRARGRRAAHQHREHDLPRSELAQEGRATARCA